ncbi:MAG: metal ABC transporter permease [Pseudomonadota bacterium]
MFEPFFLSAMAAGIGVALVAGPFGCFVVWRRLSYFGDTLAHASLLGVALALLIDVPLVFAVFIVCAAVSLLLMALQSRIDVGGDALLGLLSHASLALGLVVLSLLTFVPLDLMGLLFGDILSVTTHDLLVIWCGGGAMVLALFWFWEPLFAATVNEELAEAEGLDPRRAQLAFMLLMACVIAISIKMIGALLITALLIIPAATARRLSSGPEMMAVLAALIGVFSVVLGLFASLTIDTPSGPSIVVAAALLFGMVQLIVPLIAGVTSNRR